MNEVREVMSMLWLGEPLPKEYLDHELKGAWTGNHECHIRGDFLLVYQVTDQEVIFVDLGSHSELFG
jgi:mRNA interferase YafQ